MASKDSPECELFKTQLDELKQIKTDVEQLEKELIMARTKYHERLAEYGAKFEQLHSQAGKVRQEQIEKEADLQNASAEWRDVKSRLEASTIPSNEKVKLNVGGVYFETTIDRLTKCSEDKLSYFKALFSRQWELEKDPTDGSIFIDRSGELFWHILQYFRTGQLIIDDDDVTLRQSLIVEAEFYKIESIINILKLNKTKPQSSSIEQKQFYLGSEILSSEHQLQLNKFYGVNNQQWRLIYRASRDGFTAQSFHKRCDDCSPTMSVIKSSSGYVFGGFTTVPWSSTHQDKSDARAFLFTLENPHRIKPTKYVINERSAAFAISHRKTNGPTFGSTHNGGSDIHLQDPFNMSGSRIFFPRTYIDTTSKGRITFTGDSHFSCKDVEIFLLVSS